MIYYDLLANFSIEQRFCHIFCAYILVQSRRRRLVSEQNELLSLLKESYTFVQCFLRFLRICFFQSSLSVLYSFSRSLDSFTLVLVTLLVKLRNRITLDPLYIC